MLCHWYKQSTSRSDQLVFKPYEAEGIVHEFLPLTTYLGTVYSESQRIYCRGSASFTGWRASGRAGYLCSTVSVAIMHNSIPRQTLPSVSSVRVTLTSFSTLLIHNFQDSPLLYHNFHHQCLPLHQSLCQLCLLLRHQLWWYLNGP